MEAVSSHSLRTLPTLLTLLILVLLIALLLTLFTHGSESGESGFGGIQIQYRNRSPGFRIKRYMKLAYWRNVRSRVVHYWRQDVSRFQRRTRKGTEQLARAMACCFQCLIIKGRNKLNCLLQIQRNNFQVQEAIFFWCNCISLNNIICPFGLRLQSKHVEGNL